MGADLLSSASVIDPFLAQIKAEGDKLSGITPTTSGGGYSPLLIVGAVLLVLLLVKRGCLMDPQLMMAGASIVGNALRPAAAAPSSADPINEIGIDFSNWTVATGGGSATAANDKTTVPQWFPLVAVLVAGVVAVKWIAKR